MLAQQNGQMREPQFSFAWRTFACPTQRRSTVDRHLPVRPDPRRRCGRPLCHGRPGADFAPGVDATGIPSRPRRAPARVPRWAKGRVLVTVPRRHGRDVTVPVDLAQLAPPSCPRVHLLTNPPDAWTPRPRSDGMGHGVWVSCALSWSRLQCCACASRARRRRLARDQGSLERPTRSRLRQIVAAIGATNCSSSQSCLLDPRKSLSRQRPAFRRYRRRLRQACLTFCAAIMRGRTACPSATSTASAARAAICATPTPRTSRLTARHRRPRHRHRRPLGVRAMLDTVFSGTYRSMPARSAACGPISIPGPAAWLHSIRSIVYDVNGHVGIV